MQEFASVQKSREQRETETEGERKLEREERERDEPTKSICLAQSSDRGSHRVVELERKCFLSYFSESFVQKNNNFREIK